MQDFEQYRAGSLPTADRNLGGCPSARLVELAKAFWEDPLLGAQHRAPEETTQRTAAALLRSLGVLPKNTQ